MVGRQQMKVIVYNERGHPIEKIDKLLVPKPTTATGTLYVEYESKSFKVVTRLERQPGEQETERVVAVKVGNEVRIYEDIPEPIAERLGVARTEAVKKKVTV
jgi:hypothetical protein